MKITIEERCLTATQALEVKTALKTSAIQFGSWKNAGELDLALEALIQGRHKVVVNDAKPKKQAMR